MLCLLSGKGEGLQELEHFGVRPCFRRVGHRSFGLLALALGWGEHPNPDFGVVGTSQNLMGHFCDSGVDGV